MSHGLRMAGRIRKFSGIAGNKKITKMLCPKEDVIKRAATENVNEIKGLDDDEFATCQNMIEKLMEKMDHLTGVVKKLSRDSIATKETLSKVYFRPMPWESDISSSQQRIFYLEWKLEALEKGLKRNDLVISGIEIDKGNICESVRFFFEDAFQRFVGIEKATLVNRIKKPSLILVTLSNIEDKNRIMAEREKLKGTGIYINNRETTYDRDVRRHLKLIAKNETEKGKFVSTGYRRLTVDGVQYIWKHGVGLQKLSDKD